MLDISQLIDVEVNDNRMIVFIEVNNSYLSSIDLEEEIDIAEFITPPNIIDLLHKNEIEYGIDEEAIHQFCEEVLNNEDKTLDPSKIEVARGIEAENGKDGYIDYHVNLNAKVDVDGEMHKIDFKEMMQIPIVETDDPLLTFIAPTKGIPGINVYNKEVEAKPGKVVTIKAGENTKHIENDQTIYATDSGQVTLTEKEIKVLPVYEVNKDLDLTIGNIEFNGSIVIKGDVPEGFTLNARGDITVKGIVEGAYLEAGGSVFIEEGISSQGKGKIRATLDIKAGNINQGNLEAGRSIYVNQSILHSEVIAREFVSCYKGHIIGGSISSGQIIEANDIGNRMSSKTQLYLGENKKVVEKKSYIEERMKELVEQLKKLKTIGSKMEQLQELRELSSKERITLLRQKRSYEKAKLELSELNDEYSIYTQNDMNYNEENLPKVTVHGIIYPNVEVKYSKYAKVFSQETSKVSIVYENHDFSINPL